MNGATNSATENARETVATTEKSHSLPTAKLAKPRWAGGTSTKKALIRRHGASNSPRLAARRPLSGAWINSNARSICLNSAANRASMQCAVDYGGQRRRAT